MADPIVSPTWSGPVLTIWARDDKLIPPTHTKRLADHFQNTQLIWLNDSRTQISIYEPQTLTDHLHTFPAACA